MADWETLPHPLLVRVFSYLHPKELATCSRVCSTWFDLSQSRALWKRLLRRDFNVATADRPLYEEYKRLTYQTSPIVRGKLVTSNPHVDELWNVAFSHDGNFLAVAGKDSRVTVWFVDSGRATATIRWSLPLSPIQNAQLVVFSPDDALLLVSTRRSNLSGEQIVCQVNSGNVVLRLRNVFRSVFGAWINSSWFLTSYENIQDVFHVDLVCVTDLQRITVLLTTFCDQYQFIQFGLPIKGADGYKILFESRTSASWHFVALKVQVEANGEPISLVPPKDSFDQTQPLVGSSFGLVLSPRDEEIVRLARTEKEGPPEISVHSANSLQLLHRLPTHNLPQPRGLYYCFLSVTEEIVAW